MQNAATLSPPEHAQLQRQRTQEAKNSFCFGRMAARAAVACLFRDAVPAFTVGHGIFGYPVPEPNPGGLALSIAHTGSSGAALCFPETLMMGVDIEKISAANSSTMRSAFTDREKQMQVSGTEEVLLHHLLWSAREALSKALRTGFLLPLPLLEVKAIVPLPDAYRLEFVHFSLFSAIAFRLDDFLLALVFPQKMQPDLSFVQEMIRARSLHGMPI